MLRWNVFNGSIPPPSYTSAWWQLRLQYVTQLSRTPNSLVFKRIVDFWYHLFCLLGANDEHAMPIVTCK
jgi:hypothetical protein